MIDFRRTTAAAGVLLLVALVCLASVGWYRAAVRGLAEERARAGAMEEVDAQFFRTRVEGGWIYVSKDRGSRFGVFVPDSPR